MADSGFKTGSVWGVGEEGSKHCGWFPMVKKKKKALKKLKHLLFSKYLYSHSGKAGGRRGGEALAK